MSRDVLIVDGRAYSWKRLCELRRSQLEAPRASEAKQAALFELKEDHRPACERTASRRYQQPSLLELMTRRRE